MWGSGCGAGYILIRSRFRSDKNAAVLGSKTNSVRWHELVCLDLAKDRSFYTLLIENITCATARPCQVFSKNNSTFSLVVWEYSKAVGNVVVGEVVLRICNVVMFEIVLYLRNSLHLVIEDGFEYGG